MAYGNDLLSHVPADWIVDNASLTSSSITLEAHGTAALKIANLDTMPDGLLLVLIAETYGSADKAELLVEYTDGTVVSHYVPVVDTGNGILKTELLVPEGDFKELQFVVSSTEGLVISEYSLLAPVSEDFTEVIDGVKQEIPKLLYDYNTLEFQIGQEECTISIISMKLSKNADLQGHLQINCTASEDSVVVLRIFDNEIQELYTPIEFTVERGRNSVGVPHSYLKRKIGIHNYVVTAQVKTGTITVETRGVLYTIDGGYMATRIMDVGYELYDLTLKQLPEETKPSEIWAVCIDEGKALVRSRPYNEEVAVAWNPEYIIQDAMMACIEFHGLWILRDAAIGFTLETENVPHVMWIDSTGRLWDQKGPDETTKFLLAEGVSYLSACMGYNYAPEIQYDHGIICSYIKSGIVYYKNLGRSNLTGSMLWSAERTIDQFGSNNTLIMSARLNDYRVCIGSNTKWFVSNRGYVGQSVRPELFYLSTHKETAHVAVTTYLNITEKFITSPPEGSSLVILPAMDSITVANYDYEAVIAETTLSILSNEIVSQSQFKINFNVPIRVSNNAERFVLAATPSKQYSVASLVAIDNSIVVTLTDVVDTLGPLIITITSVPLIKYKANSLFWRTIPKQICNVYIRAQKPTDEVSLTTNNDAHVHPITYLTIQEITRVAPSEAVELTTAQASASVVITDYILIGDTPI